MAVLEHSDSGARHTLSAEHLVGRGNACHLRLSSKLASLSHAELRWTGAVWEVRDLNSRNGTYVNGTKLDQGDEWALIAGMTLAFGDPDDTWILISTDAPTAYACNIAGVRRDAEAGLLILPDLAEPACTVFLRQGVWIVESADGAQRQIDDGEELTVADDTWTVYLPTAQERTVGRDSERLALDQVTLRFVVSHDQEHIELRIDHAGQSMAVPSRVYMELLLRLAEERLADRHKERGSAGSEEAVSSGDAGSGADGGAGNDDDGWVFVSAVLNKLGISDDTNGRNLLGQHIFQARRQFAELGVEGAADVVQRRRTLATTGGHRLSQLRIGARHIRIEWH